MTRARQATGKQSGPCGHYPTPPHSKLHSFFQELHGIQLSAAQLKLHLHYPSLERGKILALFVRAESRTNSFCNAFTYPRTGNLTPDT